MNNDRHGRLTERYLKKARCRMVGVTILILAIPFLMTKLKIFNLGIHNYNGLGDAMGGMMGPFVGLLAAYLSFMAFHAQIQANTQQRKQFRESLQEQQNALEKQTAQFKDSFSLQKDSLKEQVESNKRERFANQYYMMLEVHRENVATVEVNGLTGKLVYILLFQELQWFYDQTFFFFNNHRGLNNLEITDEMIYQIAYLSFFFGYGDNSTPMVRDLVDDRYKDLIQPLHIELPRAFEGFRQSQGNNIRHRYGEGHLRRLSQYFRHLFRMVKYIDEQDEVIIPFERKFSYASILRAQLSVHEQLLIFYNSLSVLGMPWIDPKSSTTGEPLLQKYCLIRSIPLNAADFYKDPEQILMVENHNGHSVFEWHEIKKRLEALAG